MASTAVCMNKRTLDKVRCAFGRAVEAFIRLAVAALDLGWMAQHVPRGCTHLWPLP